MIGRPFVIILSLVCLYSVKYVIASTQSEEESQNEVTVAFYMLPEEKWNSEVKKLFIDAVIVEANRYCSESPGECGLRFWNQPLDVNGTAIKWGFNSSSFVITSPIVTSRSSLSFEFVLLYPDGANLTASSATQFVLPEEVVQEITKNIREKVNSDSGYAIRQVDDEPFGPPPNTTLNIIIVVIACVVLVLVAIVTIALHVWDQKKQKRERKRGKKVAPVDEEGAYNPESGNGVKYVNEKTPPPQYDPYATKKTSNYFNSQEYADPDAPMVASHHRQPLDAGDAEGQQKKHKKKKRKKSKRHEEAGDTFENPNYRTYHVDSLDNDMNIPAGHVNYDDPKSLPIYKSEPKPLRKHARFGSESDNEESSGANVTNTTNL